MIVSNALESGVLTTVDVDSSHVTHGGVHDMHVGGWQLPVTNQAGIANSTEQTQAENKLHSNFTSLWQQCYALLVMNFPYINVLFSSIGYRLHCFHTTCSTICKPNLKQVINTSKTCSEFHDYLMLWDLNLERQNQNFYHRDQQQRECIRKSNWPHKQWRKTAKLLNAFIAQVGSVKCRVGILLRDNAVFVLGKFECLAAHWLYLQDLPGYTHH